MLREADDHGVQFFGRLYQVTEFRDIRTNINGRNPRQRAPIFGRILLVVLGMNQEPHSATMVRNGLPLDRVMIRIASDLLELLCLDSECNVLLHLRRSWSVSDCS